MKRAITAAVATLSLVAAQGQGASESLGFKDITIGQSSASLKNDPRFGCGKLNKPIGDEWCILRPGHRETLSGSRIKMLTVYLYNGTVHRIAITFDASDFRAVLEAAEERYGKPASSSTTVVRNMAGTEFASKTAEWVSSNGNIQIRERFTQVDESYYEITSNDAQRLFTERSKSASSSNSRDF